jgi:hypothetical protein
MPFSRRAFLKTTATAASAFVVPAILRAQTGASLTLRQEFTMEIKRNGSQPSTQGSAEYFTGTVRIDPVVPAKRTGTHPRRQCASARTAWHTHPLDHEQMCH